MNSMETEEEDGENGWVNPPLDDSLEVEHVTVDPKVAFMGELWEVVGKLVRVKRNGMVVIEVTKKFEIKVEGAPGSLRNVVGKVVGVMIIDGQVRWRLVKASDSRRFE